MSCIHTHVSLLLCVLTFLVNSEVNVTETTTNQPSLTLQPTTMSSANVTVAMERIVQPLISQSQRVLNVTKADDVSKRPTKKVFKPSPQLETDEFEFNKFPVAPAQPEAKTFSGFGGFNGFGSSEKTSLPWEPPKEFWKTRVRFPSTRPVTVNDHPYPYTKNYEDFNQKNSGIEIIKSPGFNPRGTPFIGSTGLGYDNNHFGHNYGNNFGNNPGNSLGNSLGNNLGNSVGNSLGNSVGNSLGHSLGHSLGNSLGNSFGNSLGNNLGNNLGNTGTNFGSTYGGTYGKGYSYPSDLSTTWEKIIKKPQIDEPRRQPTDLSASPWKKVIKILTAFIPIGLLISALTPSVIHITPANGTTTARGRAEGSPSTKSPLVSSLKQSKPKLQLKPVATLPLVTQHPFGLSLLTKLKADGCDERILCELLLSAEETDNSEVTIQNLLDNYIHGGKGSSAKLDNIYNAIKHGNCVSLHCESIKLNK